MTDGSPQIVPVLLGDNYRAVAVAEALQAEGFDVRTIRPPTVAPGSARLRISVNVNLTDAVTDRFVAALAAALRGDHEGHEDELATKLTKTFFNHEGHEEHEG